MYGRLSQQWGRAPSTRQSFSTQSAACCDSQQLHMLATIRCLAPYVRHVRGTYTAAAAARASNTNDIAYANKVWSAVVAGGEEEAQTNFQDAQGAKCAYSEFAAWGLRIVANTPTTTTTGSSSSSTAELQQQMQLLAEQFVQYPIMHQQQRQALVTQLLQDFRPKVDSLLAAVADGCPQANNTSSTVAACSTDATADQGYASVPATAAAAVSPAQHAPVAILEVTEAVNGAGSNKDDQVVVRVSALQPTTHLVTEQTTAAAAAAVNPAAAAISRASSAGGRRARARTALSSTLKQQQRQHSKSSTASPAPQPEQQQQQQPQHHHQQQQRLQPSQPHNHHQQLHTPQSITANMPRPNRPRPRRSAAYQEPAASQLGSQPGSPATSSSSSSSGVRKPLLVSPSNAAAVAAGLAQDDPTAAAAAAAAADQRRDQMAHHASIRRTPPPRLRPAAPGKQQQQQQQLIPPWQIYFGPPPHLASGHEQTNTVPSSISSISSEMQVQAEHQETEQAPGSSSSREERKKKSEATWNAFVAAAKANEERKAKLVPLDPEEKVKQRSRRWRLSRKGRLTGSALCGMLGWFNAWGKKQAGGAAVPEQVVLWRDLVGIEKKKFNKESLKRMHYGSKHESAAKQSYQGLMPHEQLEEHRSGFAVWGDDELHSWLGASPDGLLTILPDRLQLLQAAAVTPDGEIDAEVAAANAAAVDGQAAAAGAAGAAISTAAAAAAAAVAGGSKLERMSVADWVKQQTGTSLEGVLEIKCPFKYSPDGKDNQLLEMPLPQEYYMMQVQTQLEVLDREWAVVYYWSSEIGSRMTLIRRDRGYFAILWQVMADFWWQHVVPAKHLLDQHGKNDPQRPAIIQQLQAHHEPLLAIDHPYKKALQSLSKKMVAQAPTRIFSKAETEEALQAGRLVIPDEDEEFESEDDDDIDEDEDELSDVDPTDLSLVEHDSSL